MSENKGAYIKSRYMVSLNQIIPVLNLALERDCDIRQMIQRRHGTADYQIRPHIENASYHGGHW